MKNKRKSKKPIKVLIALVFVVAVIGLASSFVYQSLKITDYTETYDERIEEGEIVNPAEKYSMIFEGIEIEDILNIEDLEEINNLFPNISLEDIEKEFVYYAAVKLKLYNLHEIPFTSIRPAIQIQIDERNYLIEISKGEIFVNKGIAENPDITLRTSYEEISKMAEDEEAYISESFGSGRSEVKIVANKFILFSKGYLYLYQQLEELF